MSKKRVDVDFGSMSLPVGEDAGTVGDNLPANNADPDAVRRLQAVMDRPGRRRQAPETTEEDELPSPFALFGAPDPLRPSEPEDIGLEIERLWISDGASGIREVRVKVRKEILPDTSVRLFEAEGRLNIELTVGGEAIREWLGSRLSPLARYLGERLNRPLRLAVLGVPGADRPSVSLDWPEETT